MMLVRQLLVLVCVVAVVSTRVIAQAQVAPSTPGPILYRQHLMSEELIAEQGAGYLPMHRSRFDAAIQQRSRDVPAATAPKLVEATYRARLTSDDVLLGDASCQISYRGGQPASIALSPCGLAVGQLRWRSDEDDEEVTLSAGVSQTGEFRAIVTRGGTLSFPWSLRGSKTAQGTIEFAVLFPACPRNHLLLELPSNLVPRAAGAIIQVVADQPAVEGQRLWLIDSAGSDALNLQLENPTQSPRAVKPVFARETLTYRLTTAGLELVASYHLDVTGEPIRELICEVPTSIQIASATISDRPALVESLCTLTDASVYRIAFSEPQRGTDLELAMIAVGPMVSSQKWQLPTIQLWDTLWESGTANIEIVEPLTLLSVDHPGSVARKVEPLPIPIRGELRQFQCYAPDRQWMVSLDENVQDFVADMGLTLRFAESVVTGQLIADVHAIRGKTFEVPAIVEPGWVIDTIQTEPAESFEGFHAAKVGQRKFEIKLKQALSADRKIRLIIRGRRRNPVQSSAINLAGMRFVTLEGVRTASSIVALGVEVPLQLALTGNQETLQIDRKELSPVEATRILDSTNSVIFRDVAALPAVALTHSPEQPQYSVQASVEARIDSQSLTQTYEIQVSPDSSRVARLRIRIANAGSSVLSWELVDAGENSMSARQLDSPDKATAFQEWELSLLRPLDMPFRLRATSKEKLGTEAAIGLVSVPEATSQTGLVRVLCSDGSPLDISTANMQAVSTDRTADVDIQFLRGTYRYVPSQDVSIHFRRSSGPNSLPPALIWLTHLSTRISGAGEVRHEARLYLESKGLASLSLNLPETALSWSVLVDGVHVDADSRERPARLVIPLPRGRRFPAVSVTFVTGQPVFSFASWVDSTWPTTNLVCQQRRWDVWAPPDLNVPGLPTAGWTWDKRLFGFPLVRRTKASFNPFSFDDWRSLRESARSFGPSEGDSIAINSALGPWKAFPDTVGSDEFDAGWKRFSLMLSGTEEPRLLIYSRRALQACGVGLLLIVMGVLCTLRLSRRRLASMVTISAAVILLLPVDLLPLLRGVFYGAALALLWTWVPRRALQTSRSSMGIPISSFRGESLSAGTAVSLGLTTLIVCGYASAQPAADKQGAARPVYPVLIPIDDEQKPVGEYVYVPQTLFDLLLRYSGDAEQPSLGPFLVAAQYEIDLATTDIDSEDIELRQLRAMYELSEVPIGATLRFPFRRDRVRVSDVRLDDQPATFQWSEDGRSLTVACETADCRKLTINLRPDVMDESITEFEISIPSIPRSRLTVRSDSAADRVRIPVARGVIERQSPNVVLAELGPANALRVSWADVPSSEATKLNGDVAELIWMHLQPNTAIVRAQFHLVLREGTQAEFVDIEIDPRLRLLPGSDDLAIQELQRSGSRILRCRLANPAATESTIELAFTLTGGMGSLRVPYLSANVERHAPKLLAISAADGFESVVVPTENARPIPSADFVRAWGRDDDVPQVTVSLDDSNEVWQVAVQPQSQRIHAEQQVEVVLGQNQSSINYESVVVVERGSILQQRFHVPAGFQPREIVAIHDDVDRVLRWARVDPKTLTVFFTSPISGTYRIWLKGDVFFSRSGRVEMSIPASELEGERVIPVDRVTVSYRGDVQAKLEASPGLTQAPLAALASISASQGRHLATLVAKADANGVQILQLNLSPNRPRLAGSLVTVLDHQNGRWWADISLYLQFRGGYVDDVRMRFPAELAFPIEVTPRIALEEATIPGETDRQVVAHLPRDDRRIFSMRLRCALKEQEDGEIRAPDVRLPGSDQLQRFVLLPKLLDRAPLTWDTNGLQAAELPPNHSIAEETYFAADVYQIVAPQMTAQLKSAESIRGSPHVHLADYHVCWFDDGHCTGLAAFDVEPAGLGEVTLDVPSEMQLVNVSVGTIPVSLQRDGERRWRVPLGMSSLPQRIEIVFYAKFELLDRKSRSMAFRAPVIADLPCTETFWTVQGPVQSGEGVPLLSHTATTRTNLALRRLETARKLVQLATAGVGREGSNHAEPWRANRQQWLKQLEADLFRAQSADNQAITGGRQEYGASALATPRYDLSTEWSVPVNNTGPIVYGAFRGAAGRFELQYPGATWRIVAQRVVAAILLIGLAVLTYRGFKMAWARDLLVLYPHFAVALVGFAWWMWLTPSVAGFAAMVFAAAFSLRPPWKTKAI